MILEPKPFIKWAGSKKKLVPKLKNYWLPQYNRYVEPFMGSACLFFSINPPKAILSDLNRELVTTYKQISLNTAEVYEQLMSLPKGKDDFYKIRSISPDNLTDSEVAARFIYLNRYCFNGLYRTNNLGKFNVPFSDNKTGNLPSFENLSQCAIALQNAKILCCDFEDILKEIKEGDFVYLDPPYATQNSKIFTQYGPNTFGLRDLDRLASFINEIDKRGAKFLLSYGKCKEAEEMFFKWNIEVVNITRNIAGFAQHRKLANELLISNK